MKINIAYDFQSTSLPYWSTTPMYDNLTELLTDVGNLDNLTKLKAYITYED